MFERRSALTCPEGRAASGEAQPLTLGEVRGFALLQVAAFPATVPDLGRTVRSTLGVELPHRIDLPCRAGRFCVFKVGPEQFWIVGPDEPWGASFGNAVPAAIGSVTALSHSRTRLFVEGEAAREVLAKGIALDLHPERFPCDAYALTGLQHTPVLLHRTGPQTYELYALRTFALWIWDWLTDAALPIGYDVVHREHHAPPGGAGGS